MKTITIGFSCATSTWSKIRQLVTRSSVSDMYIKFNCPNTNYLLIYRASHLSISVENYEHFKQKHNIIEELNFMVSDEAWSIMEEFVLSNIGKPILIKDILGFYYVNLMRHFDTEVDNPYTDNPYRYTCVELISYILDIYGVEDLTPQELLEFLLSHQVEL
jgi:hypothetical protein